jgi:hypothetical protein
MTTQQTVLASLSNWNEKIETTVRHLERQVAALRIGATVSVSSGDAASSGGFTGINLTDDEVHLSLRSLSPDTAYLTARCDGCQVKKALLTQQPSEILLKGVVSSEVRAMENDLEKKVCPLFLPALLAHIQDLTVAAVDGAAPECIPALYVA